MKTSRVGKGSGKPASDVVVNDKYFFAVGFKDEGTSVALVDLGRHDELLFDPKKKRRSVEFLFNDRFYALVMIGHFGDRFSDLLRMNAKSLAANEVDLDGRKVLKLTGDFVVVMDKSRPALEYTLTGSMIWLDPQLSYQVVRWEHRLPQNHTVLRSYEVQYGAEIDGVPFPSRFVESYHNPAKGSQTNDFTYANWRLDCNRPGEFTASHYGLPEPNVEPSWFSGRLRLLLIGLLCMAGGAWLYGKFKVKPGTAPSR